MSAVTINIFFARFAFIGGNAGVGLLVAGVLRWLFQYQPGDFWSVTMLISTGIIWMCVAARWGQQP